jgi:enamine deaminase RidA (YjgF/YER057c/UK114 family)
LDGSACRQAYDAVKNHSVAALVAARYRLSSGASTQGDLAAQAEQALRNVGVALAAAGATWDDVVKTTVYVVDWRPEKMAALFEGLQRSGAGAPRATTMVGVATLADPRLLVEFDVIAVTA